MNTINETMNFETKIRKHLTEHSIRMIRGYSRVMECKHYWTENELTHMGYKCRYCTCKTNSDPKLNKLIKQLLASKNK